MASKLRRWTPNVLFFASVLALLGTSKPRGWVVRGDIDGPRVAGPSRGLSVIVEASSEPHLRAQNLARNDYNSGDTPCLERWNKGAERHCLLPPGGELIGVDIAGGCPGACANECPPPAGSFVRARTTEVAVWEDRVSARKAINGPSHGKERIATTFQLRVSGAAFVEARFRKTVGANRAEGERQACRFDGFPGTKPYCSFLVFDSDVDGGAIDVEVDVIGWGQCPGDAACDPPKTLRIESFDVGVE